MTRLLVRHVLLLGLAFALSWWVVFDDPPDTISHPQEAAAEMLVSLELASDVDEAAPLASEADVSAGDIATSTEPEAAVEDKLTPAPALPELGSPLSEQDDQPQATSPAEESAAPDIDEDQALPGSTPGAQAAAMMADQSLLAAVALEAEGRGRKGFTTRLIAAPEDQLEIARVFGEELVLIPFRSLTPEASDHSWYRMTWQGEPRVEQVSTPPPLSNYQQYRDLFGYEYSRLPSALRKLRRSVLSRSEIYLFAALISTREWALVIGRRRQALERSGRSEEEVSTYQIRYRKLADAGFDVEVVEINFADGSLFRPPTKAADAGTTTDHPSFETEQP